MLKKIFFAAKIGSRRNTEEGSYVRFVLSPPKSFFKELFIGNTKLAVALKNMTDRNGVLKGLKNQECERGQVGRRPPIGYVPVVDEVQDQIALSNSGKNTEKLKMPNGTTINAGVWLSGTPEQFLNHVKNTLSYITRKGLFNYHLNAHTKSKEARNLYNEALESAETSKEEGADDEVIEEYKKQAATYEAEADKAEADRVAAAEGIFSLYSNLLSVEQRIWWDKIVEQQIDTTPWTDLRGVKRTKVYLKSEKSFRLCVTRHLLTIFDEDAAERQSYYIHNILKKPQRVSVRAFFTRVEQLNSYIALLPSVYWSPKATEHTEPAAPFKEAQLATMLLRMCPVTWQNQYELTQVTLPQDTRRLLVVLENIEKAVVPSSTVPMKPPSKNGGNASGNSEKKGKRKGTNSSTDRIPKKTRFEKHCTLCQKHGGAQSTHNTSDCTKYEKDGTLKAEWGKKSSAKTAGKSKAAGGNAFSQVMDRLSKMEKAFKKGSKSASRKKKRRYSDSSSSDSE